MNPGQVRLDSCKSPGNNCAVTFPKVYQMSRFAVVGGWPVPSRSIELSPLRIQKLLQYVHAELWLCIWGAPSLMLFKGGVFWFKLWFLLRLTKKPRPTKCVGRGTRNSNWKPRPPALTKECGWKDGDRGGPAQTKQNSDKKKKNRLDINRPSHGRIWPRLGIVLLPL